MKTTLLLNAKNYFSYLIAFCVIAAMSSCSNSKYTASFQNVPSKTYTQANKVSTFEEKESTIQQEATTENEDVLVVKPTGLEIPENFTASLKEAGISEKKSAKIQKRLEKLNEALVKAEADPASAEDKKLNFAEKIMVKKAMKKAEKFLAENDIKDANDLENSEKVQQMNSNVRIGLILILVGIVAGIFIWPVGVIVGAIGVVFLILGLIG